MTGRFPTGQDPAAPRCAGCAGPVAYGRRLCPACLETAYPGLGTRPTLALYGNGASCVNCGHALTFAAWQDTAAGVYVCGPCRGWDAAAWIDR